LNTNDLSVSVKRTWRLALLWGLFLFFAGFVTMSGWRSFGNFRIIGKTVQLDLLNGMSCSEIRVNRKSYSDCVAFV
jgi:hypothetical protein